MKAAAASFLGLATLVVACRGALTDTDPIVRRAALPISRDIAQDVPRFSDWSAPVNLGAPVNSPAIEQGASISPDGRSLYFHCAGCPGTAGADIMVSHRDKIGDPWGPPQNLGSVINTAANEMAPFISPDGRHLYFSSNRPGGFGGLDLWVSVRKDKHDDFAWEPPVNLGPGVNTAADEAQASVFLSGDGDDGDSDVSRTIVLYFSRGPNGGTNLFQSIAPYDGSFGSASPIAELNTSNIERQPGVRRDGLELFFASDRPGTYGALDLWVTTRSTTQDPWGTPVNLGPVVNSTDIDARPTLSKDATQLYFQSPRPGGLGMFDLYVATRRRLDD